MTAGKTSRWLDLLAYLLQHRYPVTREQIYEHVAEYKSDHEAGAGSDTAQESLRRKFERDKDELISLGIRIETMPDGEGYRLRERDFYLPYLDASAVKPYPGVQRIPIERDDLAMLDRATRRVAESGLPVLAEAAKSARRKLEFDLALPLHAIERVLSRPVDGESLDVLQRAVAEHIAVTCRYFAIGRDQEEERVIEPYGLFFSWGRWYVVAFSRERGAMRVFRVDRMKSAQLMKGKGSSFDVPADFRIRDYVHRAPWELGEGPGTPVRVRFDFPESRAVLAQRLGEPVEEVLEDGGSLVEFDVREKGAFLRWVLTFGRKAAIVGPLADELEALRRKVAERYA